MQVAATDVAVAGQLADALTDVLPHVKAWNLEAQTFASNENIRQSLRRLFSDIIVLLVQARIHVKTPRFRRAWNSTFSSELADTFDSVRRCTKTLNHWLRQASSHRKKLDLPRFCSADSCKGAAQEQLEQGNHRSSPSVS